MSKIPNGLCQCGCGEKTCFMHRGKKSAFASFKRGHRTGQHNLAWKSGTTHYKGRLWILMPSHPQVNTKGYVANARLIAEKALGKVLSPLHPIHHFDGNHQNDENKNLVICQDQAYHMLLHRRTRAYRACGHTSWRKCWICQEWDSPEKLYINPNGRDAHHQTCRKERAALLASGAVVIEEVGSE